MKRLKPGRVAIRRNVNLSLKWVAGFLILMLGLGCSGSSENPGGQALSQGVGSSITAVLLAGKDTPVGTVTVSVEGHRLNVKYSLDSPWTMVESHLDVQKDWRLIPQTKTHNPIPGHFAHKKRHDPAVDEHVYQVDLSDEENALLYIAAHAEVVSSAPGTSAEGAWAGGTRFTEKGNWATWFSLNTRPQVRECSAVPCMPNLARAATVSVSSTVGRSSDQPDPKWIKEWAVDGNRDALEDAYGWSSARRSSEQGTEWIQFDFGTRRSLNEVQLYARNDATEGSDFGDGFPQDFVIETSQDGVRWTPVVSRVNHPIPEDELQAFTFPGVQTRFVRVRATRLTLVGNGAYSFQLAEVEIYDNPTLLTYTFSDGEQAELTFNEGQALVDEDVAVADTTELDTLFVEYQAYINEVGPDPEDVPVDAQGGENRFNALSAGINTHQRCKFWQVTCWKRKFIDSRWPNNTVHYEFHRKVSDANRTTIRNIIADWNSRAPVQWVEDTSRFSRVMFKVKDLHKSCGNSMVGRTGLPQKIRIDPNCVTSHTVQHEMGHAVGLMHEHQRCDRDTYVSVGSNDRNTRKRCLRKWTTFGPYDYSSMMHYWDASVVSPQPLGSVGSSVGMGSTSLGCHDRLGIHKLYGVSGGPAPTSTGVLDCNFARTATVTVSSTTGPNPNQPDGRWISSWAFNGERNSLIGAYGWSSMVAGTSGTVEWIQFALTTERRVSRVDMYPRNDGTFGTVVGDGFPVDFTIELSSDGVTWTPVVSKTGYPRPTSVQTFEFTAQPARFVRVRATRLRSVGGGFYFQVAEVEIF